MLVNPISDIISNRRRTPMNLIETINQIVNERDSIFDHIALCSGVSELAYMILYIIETEKDKNWIQSDLADSFFFSRKSVNSAVSKLSNEGLIYLDSSTYNGNKKVLKLTDKGKEFSAKWIVPVIKASDESFLALNEEELRLMIELERKQLDAFKKIIKETNLISR